MNEKITLQDIVNLFSQKQGIGKKEADLIVRTMFDLIEEALKTENYVKIKGFGTFKLTEVDARESVNVNTGERFEIQGHSKISFTPDTTMKDLINKPFAHFETVILNDGVELEDTPTEEVAEAPEMLEEAPAIVEATPAVAEETPVVVEETIIEETPATEVTEVPVVVEKEPAIVEETPAVEEPIEEVVEETTPEQAEETPVVVEPAIEELIASEPVTETIPEEKPIITEEEPVVAQTKQDKKEKNINRILWGVIVVLILIILFGAYWMFFRSDNAHEVTPMPSVPEEVATLVEETIPMDTIFECEPPIYMQPLKLTDEELRKERVPVLGDTLEYVINGKEPICEHTLQSGETIIRISVKYYGSKRFWPYIAKFNKETITDPDNIPIGTVIKIPAILPKEAIKGK